MKNHLKWAIQQVYACFKTTLFALRLLARKQKGLRMVQPKTHLIITYLRAWKQNLFTQLILLTSSTHQQWEWRPVSTQLTSLVRSDGTTPAPGHKAIYTPAILCWAQVWMCLILIPLTPHHTELTSVSGNARVQNTLVASLLIRNRWLLQWDSRKPKFPNA